ncbi:MAG: NADP-dependent phosphogluconate dehydrogenase, partial [Lentilitoribacter sp.]
SKVLSGPEPFVHSDEQKEDIINKLEQALYCSKICAYAQGFKLMAIAAKEHGWQLEFGEIAKIWRAGCIIRAVFLQSISKAYENNEELSNLLMDPFFANEISEFQSDWRQSIAQATIAGVPCPAMMSSLSYYDSYRTAVLPANLLQGQRDFFGAHTYQRVDKPAGKKYHLEWSDPQRPQTSIKR